MANRADFAPELGALKSLRPFVFWAQTTLPTVFDDSLSYYEVLTKLCKMVNTMLENEDTNAENIAALAEAYQELEDFTNNYFENLDVTQEINDKLDELVADGTIGGYVVDRANTLLNEYLYGEDGESGKNKEINDMISEAQTDIEEALANFTTRSNQAVTTFELNSAASIRTFEDRVDDEIAGVPTIIEDWMDENFTNPSSVVIDDTLTVKDAAAEAYATGKLMDDATNMVLATSYWQDYVVDSVSGSFILADVSGGSNPAVGTGAPSKTLYIANVTPGETYIVSGVASSYSTTRYTPAYALGNLTYDASDNPYYEFYDVYPRGWDESQDPGTVYQYVRNQTVRIPTGTTPAVTHLFIVGDSRVPITVRCSRLNARTDTALTSETLPAQGKATGDALDTKIPWPVTEGSKDVGTAGKRLASNGDGTTRWDVDDTEDLRNAVIKLRDDFDEVTTSDSSYDTEDNLITEYLQTGYYNDSGVYTAGANFSYTIIDVEGVRKVKISGTHHVYTIAQFGAFGVVVDANGTLINDIKDIYGGTPEAEPYELELPSNAKYIYLNTDYNASYYTDSFPAGLYCYPFVEGVALKTDKLNVPATTWNELSAANKKIKILAGVIRNSGNGWEFINDSGHEPLNLSSVSVNNSGQIVLDYGFTAKKVLSLVVCPDETFARLYRAGASVGASQAIINVYELPTNIGGMVQFSNGEWDLSKSDYTSASFNDSTGILTLSHKDLRNFADSDIYRVTASSNSGICSVTSIGYDATQICLRNYSGEIITSLPNNTRLFISQPLNARYVNASYVVNASANFWIYGVMEIE